MSHIVKIIFSLTLFVSISIGAKTKPKWISDVSVIKACKKKNLCAIGVGPSINTAKRDSHVSLAKIFETKINSKFTSKLTESSEFAKEELEEIVDEVLSGIEILKIYEGPADVYALAKINKSKAARGFKNEIMKLDEKMKVLSLKTSTKSFRSIEHFYMQRENLNKKYSFLTGFGVKEVVNYEQILKMKKRFSKIIAHVYLEESEPKEIEALLLKLFSDLGIRVSHGIKRNIRSTHIVSGSLISDKMYMKIKGFEKYKFVLKLISKDIKHIGSGALDFTTVTTGRNFSQCYNKALVVIKKHLLENLDKLNIE